MKKNKIFWGLFFIIAGLVIVLNQLNLFVEINLISLILTIFLTAILIKSICHLSFTGILFSVAFILIIFSKELGIESLTPWPILFSALFGSIGLSLIFGKFHLHYYKKKFTSEEVNNDNVVNVEVSFGSSSKYINSNNLEKINLSCHFGEAKVYLDNAKIREDSAIIDLDVSFSGVELYIPKEYKLENKASVSLGDIEEKYKNNNVTNKTIILTGKTSFSGVEIIYI